MIDTNPVIYSKFLQLIMARSPEERLLMGFSMFDAAKQIVRDALINLNPEITPHKMKMEIFLRFYGIDFDRTSKENILSFLEQSNVNAF